MDSVSGPSSCINRTKRKRSVLSLEKKVEIIQRIHNGETLRNLSMEYKLGYSTVRDLRKGAEKILRFVSENESRDGLMQRKMMKVSKNLGVEEALYEWVMEQRMEGKCISGAALQRKALELNGQLGGDGSFTASPGWIHRFKSRHGITRNSKGDHLSVNLEAMEDFKRQVDQIVKEEEELPMNQGAGMEEIREVIEVTPELAAILRLPSYDEVDNNDDANWAHFVDKANPPPSFHNSGQRGSHFTGSIPPPVDSSRRSEVKNVPVDRRVSPCEAVEALDTVLKYLHQQPHMKDANKKVLLKQLRGEIIESMQQHEKCQETE